IAHTDHYVDADDDLLAQIVKILDVEGIEVREVERHFYEEVPDPYGPQGEYVLVLEATRGNRTLRRRCNWDIDAVMTAIDIMLAQLDSTRRIFAVVPEQSHQRVFVVLTHAQRQA